MRKLIAVLLFILPAMFVQAQETTYKHEYRQTQNGVQRLEITRDDRVIGSDYLEFPEDFPHSDVTAGQLDTLFSNEINEPITVTIEGKPEAIFNLPIVKIRTHSTAYYYNQRMTRPEVYELTDRRAAESRIEKSYELSVMLLYVLVFLILVIAAGLTWLAKIAENSSRSPIKRRKWYTTASLVITAFWLLLSFLSVQGVVMSGYFFGQVLIFHIGCIGIGFLVMEGLSILFLSRQPEESPEQSSEPTVPPNTDIV